jgi:hypothetical protein
MYPILGLVVLVLDIIAIIQIVQSSMDGTKKAIWVLIVLLLPFVGMILWYLLGKSQG